ncbi:MAG TPA: hemerythrin domain-containing protein [Sphingomicrobium sp.]|nr:hemerythrin domain-containing protein [Sphingomicrobium sp.]
MTVYVKNASVPPHLIDDRDPPAIALLKEDHQVLRALFDLVETIDEDVLFPIAGEICIRLAIHMNIEEELLYPSLGRVIEPAEIDSALVEHQLAKRTISRIMDTTGPGSLLRARVHALGEKVVGHIDQEDRGFLRDARRAWEDGRVDLVAIGVEMQCRRRDLFTLVGSAAAKSRAFDVDLPAEAVECLAQSGPSFDGQAWTARAGSGSPRSG